MSKPTPEEKAAFVAFSERVKEITGAKSMPQIARTLGVTYCAYQGSQKRAIVRSDWVLHLYMTRGVRPQYLLHGDGPVFTNEREKEQPDEQANESA